MSARTAAPPLAPWARAVLLTTGLAFSLLFCPAESWAQAASLDRDEPILQAREALNKRDKPKLASLRAQVLEARHPLSAWVDYWDLSNRLFEVSTPEVEAFYARWPGSYVEDRLRNDWLLEVGRRRDWPSFARELPRFRMNDDREVQCYALVAEQLAGHEISADAARRAWMAQKDVDNGCQFMAQSFVAAKLFTEDDVWRKLRHTIEHNRQRQARNTAALLEGDVGKPLEELLGNPSRYLARKASAQGRHRADLTALALARLASADPEAAAKVLTDRWGASLTSAQAAWAWAITARQGGLALHPQSLEWSRKAWASLKKRESDRPDWSDETLAWHARIALRLGEGSERWALALRSIDAMSTTERNEAVWQYWRARAGLGLAKVGVAGDAQRQEARQILAALAPQIGYYGQLASEDLGNLQATPPRPAPITAAEREGARTHPGLQRALLLLSAGLRPEALREWNFSLIGMTDRQLLAAAQLACEHEVWDRCVNSSERTRAEFDMEQRFPTPLRNELVQRSTEVALDPAYAYGLIRQESRFIMDARSHAGASGLMQIMPATAKWTAKKIGMTDFKPAQLGERDVNLRLGTAYLKLVLDDFSGSQALAAAAYNAGPGRPRRWREGPVIDAAIWVENVPFNETRDYVKKVLSNATYYAAQLTGKPASLRARLGNTIGPRDAAVPEPAPDLP